MKTESFSPAHVGLFSVIILVCVSWPSPIWACAGCRNPNFTLSRSASGGAEANSLHVTASVRTIPAWVSHPAGCTDPSNCDEITPQPEHSHDLFLLPVQLTTSLVWTFASNLTLEAHFPVRMVLSSVSYETPDGRTYTPVDADVHHRNETLVGLGDAQVRVGVTTDIDAWRVTARLGVSLPFGRTEPNPFALGDSGLEHQHIQFGNGTFDPFVALDLTHALEDSEWNLYGQIQGSMNDNTHGFRAGTRGLVGLSAGWSSSPGWLLSASLEGASEGAEEWDGQVRQEGNLGRTEILIGVQIWWSDDQSTLSVDLRTPVYRHLVGGEEDVGDLTSPLSLSLSAGWLF